jgi:hypothetical protein
MFVPEEPASVPTTCPATLMATALLEIEELKKMTTTMEISETFEYQGQVDLVDGTAGLARCATAERAREPVPVFRSERAVLALALATT